MSWCLEKGTFAIGWQITALTTMKHARMLRSARTHHCTALRRKSVVSRQYLGLEASIISTFGRHERYAQHRFLCTEVGWDSWQAQAQVFVLFGQEPRSPAVDMQVEAHRGHGDRLL